MKYTAEEVRAIAKRLHDDITVADGDALMASDMLTANAALVEAMKLPDGYEVVEHLPGIWGYEYDRDDGERMASSASWNHPALAAIGAWRDHVEALAESAEPVARGELFGYVYQSPDDDLVFEYVNDRWSAGLRYGSYTETPVYAAQPAQSVDVEPVAWLCDNGASENLMVTLSPRGRDAYAALGRTITPLYTHPAPPIDLAAVREVIESHINEAKKLRHDPESQDYLYEQADKLEAALQEKGNG